MAGKSSTSTLSARERQIVDVVTELGKATVRDITDRLPNAPTPNAVRTTVGILVRKGHLRASRRGRESVYTLAASKRTLARRAFRDLLRVFFAGSIERAVVSYLTDPEAEYTEEELREIERVVHELKQRKHGRG